MRLQLAFRASEEKRMGSLRFTFILSVVFLTLLPRAAAVFAADLADVNATNITVHYKIPVDGKPDEDASVSQTWAPVTAANLVDSNGRVDERLVEQLLALQKAGAQPVVFYEIEEDDAAAKAPSGETARKPAAADKNPEDAAVSAVRAELEKRGVQTVTFAIPRAVLGKLTGAVDALMRQFYKTSVGQTVRANQQPITHSETSFGLIMTSCRFALNSFAYFSMSGISPMTAAFLTVFTTTYSGIFNYYGRTMESLIRVAHLGTGTEKVSEWRAFWRRMGLNFVVAGVAAVVTYGVTGNHTAAYLQALQNFLLSATGDALIGRLRFKVFMGGGAKPGPEAGRAQAMFSFFTFLALAPITVIDFYNVHGHVIADIHHWFFLKTTTLAMISAYTAAISILTVAPGLVTRTMLTADRSLRKWIGWVRGDKAPPEVVVEDWQPCQQYLKPGADGAKTARDPAAENCRIPPPRRPKAVLKPAMTH